MAIYQIAVIISVSFICLLVISVVLSNKRIRNSNSNYPNIDLINFDRVSQELYRGGQPSKNDLEELKKIGIKTVIDFTSENHNPNEREWVEGTGMQYIHLPWEPDALKSFKYDYQIIVDKFLKVLNQKSNQPIFLHCFHGKDRTGLVVGVYRIIHEDWNAAEVLKEMESYGYNRFTHFTLWLFIHNYSSKWENRPNPSILSN